MSSVADPGTAPVRPVSGRRVPALTGLRRQGAVPPLVALVAFVAIYAVINPDLFSRFQLQTVANLVAPLALVALAQLLVVIVGGIDISVAAAMSLGNVVFASLAATTSPLLAAGLAILAAVACGAFNGVLVAYARLPAIATTLASAFIFGALAQEVLDRPGGAIPESFTLALSGEVLPYVPAALVWVLVASGVLWAFLNRTALGRRVYGAGSNEEALRATGHDPRVAQMAAFLMAGVLVGIAALLLAGSTATGDPKSGDPYLLSAIAAVALGGARFGGGTGSVSGTVAAAVILGLIGNLLFFAGVNSYWQYVVGSLIIVGVVAVPALTRRRVGKAGA